MAEKVINLWPDGCEYNSDELTPNIEVYLPDTPRDGDKTPAVIVFPGGGYANRADHEGRPVAEHFRDLGYVAFVLHYRVSPNRFPAPYSDGCRGVRLVRQMSSEFGVDPCRIAIMGFSAGGHLVSTIATQPKLHIDPIDDLAGKHSARPDRLILCYPVISFVTQPHTGSAINLLGEESLNQCEKLKSFSNELHVTENNPPVFAFHTADDPAVPASNSTNFILACIDKGIKAEMHIFQHGRHGVGLAKDDAKLKIWVDILDAWMEDF